MQERCYPFTSLLVRFSVSRSMRIADFSDLFLGPSPLGEDSAILLGFL